MDLGSIDLGLAAFVFAKGGLLLGLYVMMRQARRAAEEARRAEAATQPSGRAVAADNA